jgi:hypothetical protein
MDLLERAYSRNPSPPIPDPDPPFVEKIRYDPETLRRIPKTYIMCTKSDFADLTIHSKEKVEAEIRSGGKWTYLEIPSSHVPMADMPEQLNRVLLKIAEW